MTNATALCDSYVEHGDFDDVTGLSATGITEAPAAPTALQYYHDPLSIGFETVSACWSKLLLRAVQVHSF